MNRNNHGCDDDDDADDDDDDDDDDDVKSRCCCCFFRDGSRARGSTCARAPRQRGGDAQVEERIEENKARPEEEEAEEVRDL